MKLAILLLSCLSCFGQWTLTKWDAFSGHYSLTTNLTIPNKSSLSYAVLMTQPVTNIVDTEVHLGVHGAVFGFRGEGLSNTGPYPASARFYFTCLTNIYSNIDSSHNPNNYWFSTNYVNLNSPGSMLVQVAPEQWGNGVGQQDSDGFNACLANVQQFGFAFGGGSFYDVGVAVKIGGEARLEIQP